MQPDQLNRRKRLSFAWPFLGYYQNFDFYGLHILGDTERHSMSDVDSQGMECGACSTVFPDSYVSKIAGGVNFSFVTLIVL